MSNGGSEKLEGKSEWKPRVTERLVRAEALKSRKGNRGLLYSVIATT